MSDDRRKFPRYDIRLPIAFSCAGVEGSGWVVNLSREGCCVDSDALPQAGSHLDLRIELPQGEAPLSIEGAAVRWVAGGQLGIHFLYLTQPNHIRLDALVDALEGRHAPQHHSSGQGG